MAPSSLKKMSGGEEVEEEGNHASTNIPRSLSISLNRDLGLTLSPGSQIQRADYCPNHGFELDLSISDRSQSLVEPSLNLLELGKLRGTEVPETVIDVGEVHSAYDAYKPCASCYLKNGEGRKTRNLKPFKVGISDTGKHVLSLDDCESASVTFDAAGVDSARAKAGKLENEKASLPTEECGGRVEQPGLSGISSVSEIFRFLPDHSHGNSPIFFFQRQTNTHSSAYNHSSSSNYETALNSATFDKASTAVALPVLEQSPAELQQFKLPSPVGTKYVPSSVTKQLEQPIGCPLTRRSTLNISQHITQSRNQVSKSWTSHFPFTSTKCKRKDHTSRPPTSRTVAPSPASTQTQTSSSIHLNQDQNSFSSFQNQRLASLESSLSRHRRLVSGRRTRSLPNLPRTLCKPDMDFIDPVFHTLPTGPNDLRLPSSNVPFIDDHLDVSGVHTQNGGPYPMNRPNQLYTTMDQGFHGQGNHHTPMWNPPFNDTGSVAPPSMHPSHPQFSNYINNTHDPMSQGAPQHANSVRMTPLPHSQSVNTVPTPQPPHSQKSNTNGAGTNMRAHVNSMTTPVRQPVNGRPATPTVSPHYAEVGVPSGGLQPTRYPSSQKFPKEAILREAEYKSTIAKMRDHGEQCRVMHEKLREAYQKLYDAYNQSQQENRVLRGCLTWHEQGHQLPQLMELGHSFGHQSQMVSALRQENTELNQNNPHLLPSLERSRACLRSNESIAHAILQNDLPNANKSAQSDTHHGVTNESSNTDPKVVQRFSESTHSPSSSDPKRSTPAAATFGQADAAESIGPGAAGPVSEPQSSSHGSPPSTKSSGKAKEPSQDNLIDLTDETAPSLLQGDVSSAQPEPCRGLQKTDRSWIKGCNGNLGGWSPKCGNVWPKDAAVDINGRPRIQASRKRPRDTCETAPVSVSEQDAQVQATSSAERPAKRPAPSKKVSPKKKAKQPTADKQSKSSADAQGPSKQPRKIRKSYPRKKQTQQAASKALTEVTTQSSHLASEGKVNEKASVSPPHENLFEYLVEGSDNEELAGSGSELVIEDPDAEVEKAPNDLVADDDDDDAEFAAQVEAAMAAEANAENQAPSNAPFIAAEDMNVDAENADHGSHDFSESEESEEE
ncbi:hypothetical protein ACLMJK_007243 [Lecanora helva]